MEHSETLESIIDKQGLTNTMRDIEQICYEKAEHVRANWQDYTLAQQWERAGKRLGTESTKIDI